MYVIWVEKLSTFDHLLSKQDILSSFTLFQIVDYTIRCDGTHMLLRVSSFFPLKPGPLSKLQPPFCSVE